MNLTVAHMTQPKLGERANGDAVIITRGPRDTTLLGVIDGLGHGPIAAEASSAATQALKTVSLESPILELMMLLHSALRGTRGAAATLCILRGRKLETCAVGNVQLTCTNTSIPLVLSAGVLGHRVPRFRVCQAELKADARVALYSDGISSRFRTDEIDRMPPSEACKRVFERHRKHEDDATIVIAHLDG